MLAVLVGVVGGAGRHPADPRRGGGRPLGPAARRPAPAAARWSARTLAVVLLRDRASSGRRWRSACCWPARRRPGAVLFGALVGGTGMAGAALGVLAAQLLAERRAASGLAVAVLLAGLLARMVADGVAGAGLAAVDHARSG